MVMIATWWIFHYAQKSMLTVDDAMTKMRDLSSVHKLLIRYFGIPILLCGQIKSPMFL